MDAIKLDVKTLITVGGIFVALGGFYYTTQLRLESLEEKVQVLSENSRSAHKSNEWASKQIKRLNKRINQLEK